MPAQSPSARTSRRQVLRGMGAGAIGAAALPLAACGSVAPAAQATSDASTLTFLISNFDTGWVPSASGISSYEANAWGQITDKLIHTDATGNLTPWIAQSWEANEDSTVFVLHLREGVTFSDGTPLDAAAVVANIDQWAIGRPDDGIARVGLFPAANYTGSEALDALTVQVTFSATALGFLPTLGFHGCILLAPSSLALPLEEQSELRNQIGSGPFVVESWAQNDHVTLVRREDYDWAPPEVSAHTGPAHLERIVFKILPDDMLRASAARGHQTDIAYNVNPQILSSFTDAGFTVDVPRYLGFVHGFRIRVTNEPFDDVNVRRAIQHGIDREEILETIYTPAWRIGTSWLQSGVPEAHDLSDLLTYDPELASSLLDESGWTERAADGTRRKDGAELTLQLFPTPFLTASEEEIELIGQQLERIGFRVSQQKLDVTNYAARVDSNPEQPLSEVTRSFIDVGTVAAVITDQGEDWFLLGESDPEVTRLRDEIAGATTREGRVSSVEELERHVLEQAYFIPLEEQGQRIYVQSAAVTGVTYNAVAIPSYYDAKKEA